MIEVAHCGQGSHVSLLWFADPERMRGSSAFKVRLTTSLACAEAFPGASGASLLASDSLWLMFKQDACDFSASIP